MVGGFRTNYVRFILSPVMYFYKKQTKRTEVVHTNAIQGSLMFKFLGSFSKIRVKKIYTSIYT